MTVATVERLRPSADTSSIRPSFSVTSIRPSGRKVIAQGASKSATTVFTNGSAPAGGGIAVALGPGAGASTTGGAAVSPPGAALPEQARSANGNAASRDTRPLLFMTDLSR